MVHVIRRQMWDGIPYDKPAHVISQDVEMDMRGAGRHLAQSFLQQAL